MHDPATTATGLHVGYILKQYPRLSETFILNEVLGHEQQGTEVSIFSLRHATEGRFHPAIGSVKGQVHYIPAADKAAFLAALQALPDLRLDRLRDVLAFSERLPEDRRSRLLLQAIDIAHRCRAQGIDHLHAHFMTVAAHTAHVVHLLTGLPYTVTAHAKDVYRTTVDWDLAAVVARHAKAVITVCDANLRYLAHRLDGSGAQLVRIYNGLGPQDPPAGTDARTAGLVLGVGRLVEKKGFDLLLDAAASLAPSMPELRVVLVGDGDQRVALGDRARHLGIDDRVTFVGPVGQDEVARWMRRAALLVAPCRVGTDGNQDALPTVLLEALGAGLPAIATPVAGIPEIITDGVEGLIVPRDNADGVASAIADLLHDDARRDAMASAGPAKLRQRFDRERTIAELASVFRAEERVG